MTKRMDDERWAILHVPAHARVIEDWVTGARRDMDRATDDSEATEQAR